jgi:hypothetical protein
MAGTYDFCLFILCVPLDFTVLLQRHFWALVRYNQKVKALNNNCKLASSKTTQNKGAYGNAPNLNTIQKNSELE